MDIRQQQLKHWLSDYFKQTFELTPIVGDASFRRYFKVSINETSYIAMDAPPEIEDCQSFVMIDRIMEQKGLSVPHIYAEDFNQGFLLLSDFGNDVYYTLLNTDNVNMLYSKAIDALHAMQDIPTTIEPQLPLFNHRLLYQELEHFTEWFVQRYLDIPLSEETKRTLSNTYDLLKRNAEAQPQCFVHRDYHSRNLMLLSNQDIGILDFQDAVVGPVTYDLVSLIRDCYIDWPDASVYAWVNQFYEQLMMNNRLVNIDLHIFTQWFDLMGIQRHLKAIFIFARKYLRDNNDLYLQFIPRTLNYIYTISKKYPELTEFHQWFSQIILPAWNNHSTTTKHVDLPV